MNNNSKSIYETASLFWLKTKQELTGISNFGTLQKKKSKEVKSRGTLTPSDKM